MSTISIPDRIMRTKSTLLITLLLFAVQCVYAQNRVTVKGTVKDESGLPLATAAVLENGTTNGVVTGNDGSYTISVKEGAILSVHILGYAPSELKLAKGQTELNFILAEDNLFLTETVVVGYGTQKKVNLTSAISVIDNDEIGTTIGTGLVTKLQGKVAGLNIRQMSSEPGSYNNSVNIRNFGTPIYIIDGIQRTTSDFNRINSEDIESISVLKDASAAIYGLNASNGVVIVTTKQGTEGKTRFKFNANVGFSSPTSLVEMTDAYGYYTLQNYASVNYGGEPVISFDELEKYRIELPGYETTDFQDLVLKKNSVRQEYNFSADGGTDKVTYYMNVNYIHDGGLLKTNDISYSKLALRSNVKAKLANDLTASINLNAYTDKKTTPSSGFNNIWRAVISTIPYRRPYANDNPEYLQNLNDGDTRNPLGLANSDLSGYNNQKISSYQITAELCYTPSWFKGFELKGRAAFDQRFIENKLLQKEYNVYDYDPENSVYRKTTLNSPSKLSNKFDKTRYVTSQLQATYKQSIANEHNIAVTAVFETRSYDYSDLKTEKMFDFYSIDEVSYTTDKDSKTTGLSQKARNMSVLGRINYDYKGKYLIELSARYDGSNRYHKDVRWGFFPVASIGWRMSEEPFMKTQNVITNLKLRASYGVVGQDQGEAYQYISAYTLGSSKWTSFEEGKTTQGINTPALVNKNLTWTKNYIADVGFDIGFWKNKLSVTFDVFQRLRTGILATRAASLPNTFGATYPQENLNSTVTRGLELSILHDNQVGDFSYSISGNMTLSREKSAYIESSKRTNAWSYYRNNTAYRYSDIVWGLNVLGQFQSQKEIDEAPIQNGARGNDFVYPGDWNYEDVNGDGVINGDDARPIAFGNTPILNYGLNFSMEWKGIDLNILFQGAAGFSARYSLVYTEPLWKNSNSAATFLDCWHKDPYNPGEWIPGKWPSTRASSASNAGLLYSENNRWRRPSDYLRLKNIEIGYSFPKKWTAKAGIQSIRIFVNGNNLLTFCDPFIKGFDPERNSTGSGSYAFDYPLTRTINIGIDLNF